MSSLIADSPELLENAGSCVRERVGIDVFSKVADMIESLVDMPETTESSHQSSCDQESSEIIPRLFAAGCAVLDVHSMLMAMPELWFPPGEAEGESCELYHKWFKTVRQAAQFVYGCTGDKAVSPRKSGSWFESYLMNSMDDDRWLATLQMSRSTFLWICNHLELDFLRRDSKFWCTVTVAAQLGSTLYHLITGADEDTVAEMFHIPRPALGSILDKCVSSIVEILGHHLAWPAEEAMSDISAGFAHHWSLPLCQGVLGTCRVKVIPNEVGVSKRGKVGDGQQSIALQAVCDSSGTFLNVFCAYPGSISEKTLLQSSGIYQRAMDGEILQLPESSHEYDSVTRPYLIGGSCHDQYSWLVVPEFSDQDLNPPPLKHDPISCLTKGRTCIDQAFHDLKEVFKSFDIGIRCDLKVAPMYVHACCVLHNIRLLMEDLEVRPSADQVVLWEE